MQKSKPFTTRSQERWWFTGLPLCHKVIPKPSESRLTERQLLSSSLVNTLLFIYYKIIYLIMQRSCAGILAACCFLLFLSVDHCRAQDYRFINYTHREGLPNTQVKCLLQDRT